MATLESKTQLGGYSQLLHDFDVRKLIAIMEQIHNTYTNWEKLKKGMGYRNMTLEEVEDIGLTLFILGRHLCALDERIAQAYQKETQNSKFTRSLAFYQKQTGRVEIVRENVLERVYFPIPKLCYFLPHKQKEELINHVNRHDSLSKLDVSSGG